MKMKLYRLILMKDVFSQYTFLSLNLGQKRVGRSTTESEFILIVLFHLMIILLKKILHI